MVIVACSFVNLMNTRNKKNQSGVSYHNRLFKKNIHISDLILYQVEQVNDIKKIFGENLRKYRAQKMLSQRALDALTGIDHGMISRMENGQVNVTLNTLAILAKSLEVSAWQLIMEEYVQKEAINEEVL